MTFKIGDSWRWGATHGKVLSHPYCYVEEGEAGKAVYFYAVSVDGSSLLEVWREGLMDTIEVWEQCPGEHRSVDRANDITYTRLERLVE